MKRIKSFSLGLFASILSFAILSCSTTVPVKVKRPSKLDMQGARTFAVLPFQPKYVDLTLDQSSFRVFFLPVVVQTKICVIKKKSVQTSHMNWKQPLQRLSIMNFKMHLE